MFEGVELSNTLDPIEPPFETERGNPRGRIAIGKIMLSLYVAPL